MTRPPLPLPSDSGLMDRGTLRARTMVIPDIWIEAGPIKDQYDIAGLNEPHIVAKVGIPPSN